MNDRIYFDNIRKIKEIISKLETGKLSLEEAKILFKAGSVLIEECEGILDSYQGTIEEIS